MIKRKVGSPRSLSRDRRGMAAVEFALIAPALITLVMGVLEMSLRFRAKEEVTRYVHQVSDMISREKTLTTASVNAVLDASVYMMKPLSTTDQLDFDVASIGFDDDGDPETLWRRLSGTVVELDVEDAAEMGAPGESVIRVGVRYRYESPITTMLGGSEMNIEVEAYARPRSVRLIPLDGVTDDGGAITTLGS